MPPTGGQKNRDASRDTSAEDGQPISSCTRAETTVTMMTQSEKPVKPKWNDLVELKQNMKTVENAVDFLVTHQYIDETADITPDILSYTLLLLSAAPSGKIIQEGTRAVGIILKDMADNNLARSVSRTIKHTLTPLVADLNQLKEAMKETMNKARNDNNQTPNKAPGPTYARALANNTENRHTSTLKN